jgi:two-component system, chemotaxis family, chemotaxis protein CheY
MPPPSTRILVVDDNDALRENLAEALHLEGYPVVAASDGPSALSRLAEDPPPSVVLLDLMLPGMSGGDVLARIRADPRLRHVKVVLTTGASVRAARAAPADAVLMKPFGVADLLAALRKVGVGA